MKLRAALVFFALASVCHAQSSVEQKLTLRTGGPEPAASEAKAPPTKEQLERGRQMLELAEAQVMGLSGGMRAYGLLQIARASQSADRNKAVALLENALAAANGMDDDQLDTRKRLQEQILQAMVPLAPQRADELLTQVRPEARGAVLRSLLGYYQKQKDLDRALEVLYRVAQESEMPYQAAQELMAGLPPERSTDALQVFGAALASYRDHEHRGLAMGDGDFATLVIRHWNRLPKEMVLDALSELLKQAKASKQANNVSMASASGAVSFNSTYEYRLFQLLPVWKQLDESGAEKLAQDYQQVQAQLGRYPQGVDSITPPEEEKKPGGSSFMVSGSGAGAPTVVSPQTAPIVMQQASKIIADASEHARDALAAAANIADLQLRAATLQGIAQITVKKNGSVTREALDKALDLAPQLNPQMQSVLLRTAADLYLKMDEPEEAKKVVERGLSLADKMLKDDSNADDPNQALKAYWPSAAAYATMLRAAVTISPAWAQDLAAGISDPDMKVLAQIAMAGALLDVPAGAITTMSMGKKGSNISVSMER